MSSGEAKLSKATMLSLQDSVFFEISIKSLLKSWSSSCEYLAKLSHMFTYHTGCHKTLSNAHNQQTPVQHCTYLHAIHVWSFIIEMAINRAVRMSDYV